MSRRVNISHQLFRVLLLAAMVLGLVLPGAAGAQGPRDREQVGGVGLLAVGPATVTVEPCDMATPAKYTVVFDTTQDLSVAQTHTDNIRIRFPLDTVVPDLITPAYVPGNIKINGEAVDNVYFYESSPGVFDYQTYVLDVTTDVPAGTVTVVFELAHGLINPSAPGNYTLEVSTSREVVFAPSNPYEICFPSGRVYIYWSRFDTLEECGQKQLDFLAAFDTIQDALDEVNRLYLDDPWPLYTGDDPENNPFGQVVGMEVHVAPDTYAETIIMDTPGVVLKSMAGPDVTIIDGAGIEPQMIISSTLNSVFDGMAGVVNILASGVTFEGFTVTGGGVGVSSQDPANYGVDNYPDYDQNGNVDIQGIFITPWNPKAYGLGGYDPVPGGDVITDTADYYTTYPVYSGRVNVYDNLIHGNEGFGIVAAAALALDINQNDSLGDDVDVVFNVKSYGPHLVALIEGNVIYDNRGGGIVGVDLSCGVEVIDPTSITMGTEAASEILNNAIRSNGFATMPDGEPAFDPIVSADNTTPAMLGSGISLYGTVEPYYEDWGGGSEGCCTIFIVNNEILGNTNNGISLWKDAANVPLVIQENTIVQNGFAGVSTAAEDVCDGEVAVDFRYNDLVGNGVWGVKNWAADLQEPIWFNAKENYWGSMGGPSEGLAPEPHKIDQRSDALGNGDAVSHYVYYNPWLSVSQATVIADGIRHYGSYLELQKGWNTLSVPVPLHSGADTLGEIATIGNWLDDALTAFQYDPALGYEQLLSGTQLVPARGYFIRMAEAGKFPVIYKSSFGLPNYNLAQGWNLVGSAFGIDRIRNTDYDQGRWAVARAARIVDGGDPEARRPAAMALDSVRNQASFIISPSVPGQIAAWSTTYTEQAGDPSPRRFFYTGEAYWVYMIGPGGLGGFEATPFHFEPDLHQWFCCDGD